MRGSLPAFGWGSDDKIPQPPGKCRLLCGWWFVCMQEAWSSIAALGSQGYLVWSRWVKPLAGTPTPPPAMDAYACGGAGGSGGTSLRI